MGGVIQFPSRPRNWTNLDCDIFSRLTRFYNRCHLVDSFVEITEGNTDEGDPWIAFARRCGDIIISITKIQTGLKARYIVKHRSRIREIDDLDEFANQLLVEDLATGNGAST